MKKLSKKAGIAIFTAVMAILAVIIVVYNNPLADRQDELLKKSIALALIAAAVIAFIVLYDKITVLPKELYQNRRLIWKLAKSDFKKRYAGSYMARSGRWYSRSSRWRCTGLYSSRFFRTGQAMHPEEHRIYRISFF